jgi:hypothetical protein
MKLETTAPDTCGPERTTGVVRSSLLGDLASVPFAFALPSASVSASAYAASSRRRDGAGGDTSVCIRASVGLAATLPSRSCKLCRGLCPATKLEPVPAPPLDAASGSSAKRIPLTIKPVSSPSFPFDPGDAGFGEPGSDSIADSRLNGSTTDVTRLPGDACECECECGETDADAGDRGDAIPTADASSSSISSGLGGKRMSRKSS